MKLKSVTVLVLFGLTLLPAEERMRAGLWEVTTSNDTKQPGITHNECYTPALVKLANSPADVVRETTEKHAVAMGCTLKEFKAGRNAMSMLKVCGAKSTAISSTYGGDAFETVVTTTGAGAKTVIQIKGKRIGDCK